MSLTIRHLRRAAVVGVFVGLGACSRPATQTAAVAPVPVVTPATATTAVAPAPVPVGAVATAQPGTPAGYPAAASPAPAPANGYSCTFPGPSGRSILARFTLDGATAHDDQGLPFNILTNSPTALILAHPRDDLATAPGGDVGAYVVAIDRRTLAMVQSTVGLNGRDATRRGRCIAG